MKKDEKKAKDAYANFAALNIKKHLKELNENKKAVVQTQADEVEEAYEEEPAAFDFPYLIMDDWNRQWSLDWNNGEEARYTLDPNYEQKTDVMDSLSDGVAYLKKADMLSGLATYRGRTFCW